MGRLALRVGPYHSHHVCIVVKVTWCREKHKITGVITWLGDQTLFLLCCVTMDSSTSPGFSSLFWKQVELLLCRTLRQGAPLGVDGAPLSATPLEWCEAAAWELGWKQNLLCLPHSLILKIQWDHAWEITLWEISTTTCLLLPLLFDGWHTDMYVAVWLWRGVLRVCVVTLGHHFNQQEVQQRGCMLRASITILAATYHHVQVLFILFFD